MTQAASLRPTYRSVKSGGNGGEVVFMRLVQRKCRQPDSCLLSLDEDGPQ